MNPKHKDLANGRWSELSLVEQLGNIGSEVGRSANARENGNIERSQRALDRALELFDLTLADKRWRGRYKEILRAREQVCDFLFGDNDYQSDRQSIERYFITFAQSARAKR